MFTMADYLCPLTSKIQLYMALLLWSFQWQMASIHSCLWRLVMLSGEDTKAPWSSSVTGAGSKAYRLAPLPAHSLLLPLWSLSSTTIMDIQPSVTAHQNTFSLKLPFWSQHLISTAVTNTTKGQDRGEHSHFTNANIQTGHLCFTEEILFPSFHFLHLFIDWFLHVFMCVGACSLWEFLLSFHLNFGIKLRLSGLTARALCWAISLANA